MHPEIYLILSSPAPLGGHPAAGVRRTRPADVLPAMAVCRPAVAMTLGVLLSRTHRRQLDRGCHRRSVAGRHVRGGSCWPDMPPNARRSSRSISSRTPAPPRAACRWVQWILAALAHASSSGAARGRRRLPHRHRTIVQRASAASGAITPGWWLGAGLACQWFGAQAAAWASVRGHPWCSRCWFSPSCSPSRLEAWFVTDGHAQWNGRGVRHDRTRLHCSCASRFAAIVGASARPVRVRGDDCRGARVPHRVGDAAESCTSHFRRCSTASPRERVRVSSALIFINDGHRAGHRQPGPRDVAARDLFAMVVIGAAIYAQQRGSVGRSANVVPGDDGDEPAVRRR